MQYDYIRSGCAKHRLRESGPQKDMMAQQAKALVPGTHMVERGDNHWSSRFLHTCFWNTNTHTHRHTHAQIIIFKLKKREKKSGKDREESEECRCTLKPEYWGFPEKGQANCQGLREEDNKIWLLN